MLDHAEVDDSILDARLKVVEAERAYANAGHVLGFAYVGLSFVAGMYIGLGGQKPTTAAVVLFGGVFFVGLTFVFWHLILQGRAAENLDQCRRELVREERAEEVYLRRQQVRPEPRRRWPCG